MRSLEHFGTIAFDAAHMRSLIGYGEIVTDGAGRYWIEPAQNPTVLQFGIWLETVPYVYRSQAYDIVRNLRAEFIHRKADARTLDAYIRAILEKVYTDLEYKPPDPWVPHGQDGPDGGWGGRYP